LAHCRSFDVAFMQIANVLGSSVISFVLIGMNYAIYNALKKSQEKQKRINGLLSAVILVAGAYSYGFITLTQSVPLPDGPLVKVCVLQTDHDYHGDLPEDQVNAIVEQNIILTRQAVAVSQTKPDLIVWPETSIPTDFLQDPALNAKMTGLAQEIGTNLLIGAAIQDADGQHNSAVLLDSHGEVRNIYHKRHLIPLTEFIPDVWPWKIFANIFSVKTPDLVEGQRDASGIMEITLRDQETVRFGVAICSEDNIDRLFYEYRRQGARFVVVLLNNGWFTQKAGFVMHAQHSIVRAIENHFPVIRSSNHGWSGMINQWGATSDESFKTLTEKKFFSYEFAAGSRKSVPNNLGDIFCVLCIGFVILMKLYTTIREKK